jgi:hypothetical protein
LTNTMKWDVVDEVVTRTAATRPVRAFVASSATQAAFSVLMLIGASSNGPGNLSYISAPHPVLEAVRIERTAPRPPLRRLPHQANETDTSVGMSTGRLADLFPRLFRPTSDDEESEEQPFFLS